MTVSSAMARYGITAADQEWHRATQQCWLCLQGRYCRIGHRIHQAVDAASIELDLAVSEASIERTRAGVAW